MGTCSYVFGFTNFPQVGVSSTIAVIGFNTLIGNGTDAVVGGTGAFTGVSGVVNWTFGEGSRDTFTFVYVREFAPTC